MQMNAFVMNTMLTFLARVVSLLKCKPMMVFKEKSENHQGLKEGSIYFIFGAVEFSRHFPTIFDKPHKGYNGSNQ